MQCPTPVTIKHEAENKYHLVPCGKCGACLSNRRSDWSFRLKQELKSSLNSFFITLTYADENLVFNGQSGYATLQKQDFQKFMKRLRKAQSKITDMKIRYYAVGEYGENTARPHYHALIFNLHPQLLQELPWNDGTYHIGEVNEASIHYVTKYHINPNEDKYIREPEFALMSRNPGIGKDYIKNNSKWHYGNDANYVVNNGFKQRLPKYYKDKIYDKITKDRQAIDAQNKAIIDYKIEKSRLKKLGKDADKYMQESAIYYAKNVKKKSINNNDKF